MSKVENTWADPAGSEAPPRAVRYLILDRKTDQVVLRETLHARDPVHGTYFRSLRTEDQVFANEVVDLVQRACAYFYEDDGAYEPLEGVPDVVISDAAVTKRIDRLNSGENQREAERVNKWQPREVRAYPLDELPWDQQRALVERVEQLKAEWRFEILGEVDHDPPARPKHGPSDYDLLDYGEGFYG